MSNNGNRLASILAKIDGSKYSHVVAELAIQWAQEHAARLSGITVIDETSYLIPFAEEPPQLYEERLQHLEEAKQAARESLAEFERMARNAGVEVRIHEETGRSLDTIRRELQRHDLVIVGRNIHQATVEQPNSRLTSLLRDTPRPVVTVPPVLPQGTGVLIAYNASHSAARVLAMLTASGLLLDRKVYVMRVHSSNRVATEDLELAVDFLDAHGIEAAALALEPQGAFHEQILETVAAYDIGLIGLGAFGRSRPMEWLLGSHTDKLIEASPVPLFLFH